MIQIQGAIAKFTVRVLVSRVAVCAPDQISPDGNIAHRGIIAFNDTPGHQVGDCSCGEGSSYGGAGSSGHRDPASSVASLDIRKGRAIHINAGSRDIWFNLVVNRKASAGMEIDASVPVIVGADGKREKGVSWIRDGSIRIWL